jgi:hypothetical protein
MKKLKQHILLAIAALAIGGCRDDNSQSILNVTNGIDIVETNLPSVVKLDMRDTQGNTFICTGTFIGPRTIITAAHCGVDGTTHFTVSYRDQKGAVYIHPEYLTNSKAGAYPPADIALVQMPTNMAPAVAKFASSPAQVGNSITYVGYGSNDLREGKSLGAGTRRRGMNKVHAVETNNGGLVISRGHNYYTTNGDARGVNSSSGHGDSGGPVITGLPSTAKRFATTPTAGIAALVHAGRGLDAKTDRAENTNIFRRENLAFLHQTLAKLGVKVPSLPPLTRGIATTYTPPANTQVANPTPDQACQQIPTMAQCQATTGCSWSAAYNDCGSQQAQPTGLSTCTILTQVTACNANPGCMWSPQYNDCGERNPSPSGQDFFADDEEDFGSFYPYEERDYYD